MFNLLNPVNFLKYQIITFWNNFYIKFKYYCYFKIIKNYYHIIFYFNYLYSFLLYFNNIYIIIIIYFTNNIT